MAKESELGDPTEGAGVLRLPAEPIRRRRVMDMAVDRNRKPDIRVDQANPRGCYRVPRRSDSRAFRAHNERAEG